jgi:hypothetical protein
MSSRLKVHQQPDPTNEAGDVVTVADMDRRLEGRCSLGFRCKTTPSLRDELHHIPDTRRCSRRLQFRRMGEMRAMPIISQPA